MTSVLGLKLRFALTYLTALACGSVAGVCAHYTILPMDWPLWRRVLWGLIAFYAVLAGRALIGMAATDRRRLQEHFFHEEQQRAAAAQRRLEWETYYDRRQT